MAVQFANPKNLNIGPKEALRKPDGHKGGERFIGSVFGPKPNFSPNASRSHGENHRFEFGHREYGGPQRQHRHHGSPRFAEHFKHNKPSFLGTLAKVGLFGAVGMLLGGLFGKKH